MATQTEAKQHGRVVVQSVLSPDLAARLKAEAERERRTVSATVRILIEDMVGKVPR